jgi:hypothetical protein
MCFFLVWARNSFLHVFSKEIESDITMCVEGIKKKSIKMHKKKGKKVPKVLQIKQKNINLYL